MDFKNLFDLTGKNAMVIGGAGGLGKLVAQGLAECGANVAIASRTESKLQAACGRSIKLSLHLPAKAHLGEGFGEQEHAARKTYGSKRKAKRRGMERIAAVTAKRMLAQQHNCQHAKNQHTVARRCGQHQRKG